MPPPSPAYRFQGNSGRRNDQRHDRSDPRHEFTFRYQPRGTADRPLLSANTSMVAEFLSGPRNDGKKPPLRFAPIEELDDSDEAEMDLSEDEKSEQGVNTATATAPAPSPPPAPKWSNPDPYTVLPPPGAGDTRQKKLDVVKLIRKAKVEMDPEKPAEKDAVADNDDFISFGDLGQTAGSGIPKGPRNDDGRQDYPLRRVGRPQKNFNEEGSIIDEWRKRPTEPGTPWFDSMEPTLQIGTRLVFFFFFFFFFCWALNSFPLF